MSDKIDRFCENLRLKLTTIDNNIQGLKAKIDAKAKSAEQDVRKEKIADWKASGERMKLRSRADLAEKYAKATAVIAASAVDEAEQAALESWLARRDAEVDAKVS
jgi:hypothetical protein